MIRKLSAVALGLIFGLILNADTTLDSGGVGVDFSKCKPMVQSTTGPNLIKNGSFEVVDENGSPVKSGGWSRSWHAHAPFGKAEATSAFREKNKDIAITTTTTDNPSDGQRCAHYITPLEIHKARFAPEKGEPMMSNGFAYNMRVPDITPGQNYDLSFKIRGAIASGVPGVNAFVALASFYDSKGQQVGVDNSLNKHFSLGKSWSEHHILIRIPNDASQIRIMLKLYGCGEAFVDDVQLRLVKMDSAVTPLLTPIACLDNTFYLSTGEPGIALIACRDNSGAKLRKPYIYLKLPKEIELLGTREDLLIESREDLHENGRDYVIYKTLILHFQDCVKPNAFTTWSALSFLIRTNAASGNFFQGAYRFVDDGIDSDWCSFDIKVIESLGRIPRPKRFKTAAMFAREANFTTSEAVNAFADFYANTGFNAVHGAFTAQVRTALKKTGIERYAQPFYLCNGYRIGKNDKTESVMFKMADGTYYSNPDKAICPVEVYQRGEYYRNQVETMIREYLVKNDICDNIMSNWEPYMFNFKGCFCDRCKDEFIKHSGLPKTEVDAVWPKDVIVKYREKWIAFRSWQHGKLMETLNQSCEKIGKESGKKSLFIPEIAWSQLTEKGNSEECPQYNPIDYLDKLPVIESWGPYIFFDFSKPYIYNTGVHLITHEGGKANQRFVAEHVKDKAKQPKLIAFPHGLQCDTWVTEPEALAFEILCYFVNGWEGAFTYYMPRGYDARWWNAVKLANRDIATYEDFVFDGERLRNVKIESLTPLPVSNLPEYWSEGGNFLEKLPGLKTAKIIQSESFLLNGKRLVAIGDFWQKGEAFVKMSLPGLEPEGKYVVSQPLLQRCFIPSTESGSWSQLLNWTTSLFGSEKDSARQYFTGTELAEGIVLHVGALRWAFYVIEAFDTEANYGTAISQSEIKAEMKKRLPEIQKTLDWENKYQESSGLKMATDAKLPDYSGMANMENNGVKCQVAKFAGATALELSFGGEKAILAPAEGAMIKSWGRGMEKFVDGSEGHIGADAFWWPQSAVAVSFIKSPYEFVKQTKTDDGLQIEFKHELELEDSGSLKGVILRKTYDFNGKGGFSITTTLSNTTGAEVEFSSRCHNVITFMGIVDQKRGLAVSGDARFERVFTQKLYRYAAKPDPNLEKAFTMEASLVTSSPNVTFSAPWLKDQVEFSVLDKDKLHCFVFWDSGKQKFSTFEPIFGKVKLAPGQSWSTSIKWTVK